MAVAPAEKEALRSDCVITYEYSVPLPTDRYAEDKNYLSRFQPRINKNASLADDASVELQLEWYGEGNIGKTVGNLNSHAGNFMALLAPECLPERLGLLAYIAEYGFVHDDYMDSAPDQESVIRENQDLLHALNGQEHIDAAPLPGVVRRKKEIRSKMASRLVEADPQFAKWFLNYWRKVVEDMVDVRSRQFRSLDEYLANRVADSGFEWILSMARWGTNIQLTPEEERAIKPITYPIHASLVLTNDLLSWESEKVAHDENNGSGPLVNAVDLFMKTESIPEEQAKLLVAAKFTEHEEQYCKLRDEFIVSFEPSDAVIRWFRCLEWAIAGNNAWSLKTQRYCDTGENPYKAYRANGYRKV